MTDEYYQRRLFEKSQQANQSQYQKLLEAMKQQDANSVAHLEGPLKALRAQRDAETASGEHDIAVEQAISRANSGLCVVCGEQPTYMRQVHRSMYAMPCNHRNGLGNAHRWNEKWAETQPLESVHIGIDMGAIEEAIDRSLGDLP